MLRLYGPVICNVLFFLVAAQPQSWKTYPYHQEGSVIYFPRDEGFHPAESTEWWYINGHVQGENSGTDYSFMLSYFYQPKFPVDGVRILSIADETNKLFYSHTLYCDYKNLSQERLNIEVQPVGGVEEKWVNIKDEFGYKPFEYQIFAVSQEGDIDITCSASKPPLMISDNGYLQLGTYGNSYYYSLTMLDVKGILTLNGLTEPINGTAWVDHQYGNIMLTVSEQYEWFSIQLSNGMDVNLWNNFKNQYQLPNTPQHKLCTIYFNELQDTTVSDFKITRLKYSFMPNSYSCYSQEWHFVWDKIDLIISTNQTDCEIFSPLQFYEGSTTIRGWVDSIPVTGIGFAELLHSYENPKIKFAGIVSEKFPNLLSINWELLNPDDGRPVLYDLEVSNDNGVKYEPIVRKLEEVFFVWDSIGFGTNSNSILRVTGYSKDSTLKGSDVVRIGDAQSLPAENQNFYLSQNYPNPFNSATKIRYAVPASSLSSNLKKGSNESRFVSLKVYDVLGNEVAVLVNEEKSPGVHEVEFSSSNLSSGIYLYRINAENYSAEKKLIILK